jgi:predicted MPP superfamily phosphohydrolase
MVPTLIVVFGVFQLILFLMHADIYQTLAFAFGLNSQWLEWLFILLSISFVSSSVLVFRFCNEFTKWYYRIAAYWFGLTQFLFGGSVIFFIIESIAGANGMYLSPVMLGIICLGGPFLIHSVATWRTAHPKVTRVNVSLPNLPPVWRGKKIVFVSDVHLGAVLGVTFAQKVVNLIKAENPEAVLIGGDIFDGVKCHSQELIEPFAELKPPHGMYFISGNHEYIEDTVKVLKEIPNVGIRVVWNEVVDMAGIQLVGVDWKETYKKEQFENVMAGIPITRTKPSILMRHEPNHLEVAESAGISLTLSGHTHAGQIWPLGYITRRIYKGFDYGLKKLGDMSVYTSSGVGTWGPPLRFGTKAEIVAITLT